MDNRTCKSLEETERSGLSLRNVLSEAETREFTRYKEKQSILRQRHKAKLSLRKNPAYKSLLKDLKTAKDLYHQVKYQRSKVLAQINQMVNEEADRLLDLEKENQPCCTN